MSKRVSKAQRAKNLIAKGYSNKYIFEHFPYIPKQAVYTARWLANKEKGLASLPKPEPVASGTGITSSAPRAAIPLEFEIIDRPEDKKVVKASNNRRKGQLKRWAREREARQNAMPIEVGMDVGGLTLTKTGDNYHWQRTKPLPKPTLWQKIKSFFVGA